MTSSYSIYSGSVLGFYGTAEDILDFLEIGSGEQYDTMTENIEIFPMPSIDQKTDILSEADQAYEGGIENTGLLYKLKRNELGEISVIILSNYTLSDASSAYYFVEPEIKNYYLPGVIITIPGSAIGGEDVTDNVVITLQPDNGLVFDEQNNYAVLNNRTVSPEIVSTGFKAQLLNRQYVKQGGIFNINQEYSISFDTFDSSITGECQYPPYDCATYVNSFCVRDFSSAWRDCEISEFPLINTSNGRNFSASWRNCAGLVFSPDAEIKNPITAYLSFFSVVDCNSTLEVFIEPGDELSWELFYIEDGVEIPVESGDENGAVVSLAECGEYVFRIEGGTNPYGLNLQGITIDEGSSPQEVNFTSYGYDSLIYDINYNYTEFLPLTPLSLVSSTTIPDGALQEYPLIIESETINGLVTRDAAGDISTIVFLQIGGDYGVGDTLIIPGSFIGGEDEVDDVELLFVSDSIKTIEEGLEEFYYSFPTLDTSRGVNFQEAWYGCSGLEHFPPLNFNNGLNFASSWENCTSLISFPPEMFDECQASNFLNAWRNCSLGGESVDNILVSLNASGVTNGIVHLDEGSNEPPSEIGLSAISNLTIKGWSVYYNVP